MLLGDFSAICGFDRFFSSFSIFRLVDQERQVAQYAGWILAATVKVQLHTGINTECQ